MTHALASGGKPASSIVAVMSQFSMAEPKTRPNQGLQQQNTLRQPCRKGKTCYKYSRTKNQLKDAVVFKASKNKKQVKSFRIHGVQ
eukprot:1149062-Pelagomonas_calceolata.AAC.1